MHYHKNVAWIQPLIFCSVDNKSKFMLTIALCNLRCTLHYYKKGKNTDILTAGCHTCTGRGKGGYPSSTVAAPISPPKICIQVLVV